MLEGVGDPGNQLTHGPLGHVGQSQGHLQTGLLLGQLLGQICPALNKGIRLSLEALTVRVLTGKGRSELREKRGQLVYLRFFSLCLLSQLLKERERKEKKSE